ncbi:type VI secretion system Vgr family protein [Lysobacter enzymogenes]|uniref:type VI secretion system Vgr family protein n=1 Tax=Lysobacter enzymogenes TaxID=69 RepID=UPI002027D11E|nr:type VI secretion system Vgr family protein [Lysobacter enzymogenes]
MTDPYSPFALGGTAAAAAAPELARFAETSALADELISMARSGGDTTALSDELITMARSALPDITRDMPTVEVAASAIETEGLLGKLAAAAPVAAMVLQSLQRGASRETVAKQLAPRALQAMGVPTSLADMADVALPAQGGLPGRAAGFAAQALSPQSFDPGDVASDLARYVPSDLPLSVPAHDAPLARQAESLLRSTPQAARALASRFVGGQHLVEIETALPGAFLVERFHGQEAVCDSFRFEIDCISTASALDTAALVGEPLTLRLQRADGSYRHWRGLCSQAAPLGSDGGYSRYRLTLEPWLALLKLRRNALIFQDRDALEVLERVFADYPQAAWRFDVARSLPKPAITTQYRESDYDFVLRLLADAGLAWRFDHAQAEDEQNAAAAQGDGGHTLVIFDSQAEVPAASPDTLRFHRTASTENEDAIGHFSELRQTTPDAVGTASWQAEQVEALSASALGDPAGPNLPRREVYSVPRSGRYAERDHAQTTAELRLDALRLPQRLHAGSGSGRGVDAGRAFTLSQHADLSGQAFVPLRVEHLAANNLTSNAVAILDASGLERGSYRNRFLAVPLGTAIVPLPRPKPIAPGAQTARVVGLADAANTVTRDHQVRIQFAWQRGAAPTYGGANETGSGAYPDGHAPGDETSGTWVRVAEWLAGPNWGSHALPRIGAEVLVEFLHADIDQPLVTGQLFNGEVAPPFAAGQDSPANHIGTLSGLHTQSLDGSGRQQWVVDDAPGQLRQRLHTTLADSRLELGYLIQHGDAQRGALRGQGFDLATLGWGNLHAAQGVLLSTTARADARSTHFDIAEAVAQLKGAQNTAQALNDAAAQNQVPALRGNPEQAAFLAAVDAQQDGKYDGDVAGQPASKPSGEGRDGGDPVERFAAAMLVAESPDSLAATTPASALAYAGGHSHLTAQDDAHFAAGQTFAAVSGAHSALYAQQGPLRAIAAAGPVSVRAHVGTLELLADQSVTVTATDERIDVLAKQKIVLQAGQTRVTLEGGDITFECPGNFTVKAGMHPFKGGETAPLVMPALPNGLADAFKYYGRLDITNQDGKPLPGKRFKLVDKDGNVVKEGKAQAMTTEYHEQDAYDVLSAYIGGESRGWEVMEFSEPLNPDEREPLAPDEREV